MNSIARLDELDQRLQTARACALQRATVDDPVWRSFEASLRQFLRWQSGSGSERDVLVLSFRASDGDAGASGRLSLAPVPPSICALPSACSSAFSTASMRSLQTL
jgi:hypothetical protein